MHVKQGVKAKAFGKIDCLLFGSFISYNTRIPQQNASSTDKRANGEKRGQLVKQAEHLCIAFIVALVLTGSSVSLMNHFRACMVRT